MQRLTLLDSDGDMVVLVVEKEAITQEDIEMYVTDTLDYHGLPVQYIIEDI